MLRRLLPWVALGTLIALFILDWRLGAVACFVVLLAVGHRANRQEEQQKAAQEALP
jgi:mannose/fructose/N-acetylgalactosamine-specific phosphotransferase system component IIC